MAPEQAGGANQQAGPAADVYALGVILYELLSGTNPFAAASDVETFRRHQDFDPPPLRAARRDVPRDLESICAAAWRNRPFRRYATGRELADDLRRFLDGAATHARPLSLLEVLGRVWRRRPVAVGLTTVGIAALVLSAFAAVVTVAAWQNAAQYQRNVELQGASMKQTSFERKLKSRRRLREKTNMSAGCKASTPPGHEARAKPPRTPFSRVSGIIGAARLFGLRVSLLSATVRRRGDL